MTTYSYAEWLLIFAAYAYEVEANPIMADATFDILCSHIDADITRIPGFVPYSGGWVHDALKGVDVAFVKSALTKLRKIGSGACVSHIRFPDGLLSSENDNPGHFNHLEP